MSIKVIKETLDVINHLQWYTSEKLQQIQNNKLRDVIAYHGKFSPWFGDRVKIEELNPQGFLAQIPLTTRQDVISAGDRFFATEVPKEHGKVGTTKSSGSTGEPVVIRATDVVSTMFHALNIQEIMWHRRNLKSRMAVVKAGNFETKVHKSWGQPHDSFGETGEFLLINGQTDIAEQDRLLRDFKPDVFMCYPSNLKALLLLWKENPLPFRLTHIKTLGETVSDELRKLCGDILKMRIEDSYSSQEVGTIANQCPQTGLYHTADENLIVEILGDDNLPVKIGESGRVVVTDLHNYATPLIRYVTGDYAIRGGKCSCGRGLGTLQKIQGRERNLIVRADGSRYWPQVGMYQFDKLDFVIRRYQVIQHDRENIEYKIMIDAPLTPEQESAFLDIVQTALGSEFKISINVVDDFPYAKNGKFEEFICKVQ